jgi:hypothetical protein
MAIPDTAKLPTDRAERLKTALEQKLIWGQRFWKPLHDRMDYWLNMYLLLDLVQQTKPLGFRRFVSNDPRTGPDAALSIMTRNESYWRIDMPPGVVDKEERERIGRIELALSGIVDDIDEMFLMRGDMPLWKQAAWFALMRGWIWGKFHVTEAALELGRPSPLLAEMYDSRQVYPNFDGVGLADVLILKYTTLAELYNQYQDAMPELDWDTVDMNAPAAKLEFWSNTRRGVPGINAVLAVYTPAQVNSGLMLTTPDEVVRTGTRAWLIPPYEHGYTPEQLPVVGVPVNGIPIKAKPFSGTLVDTSLKDRADRLGANPPSWHDPSGWVAESGRSILAAVEENIPQYNELMATALQHFSIGTYGQWVFKTSSGELPEFEEGLNARIPLHIGEEVQRFEPAPISRDAWQLMQVLKEERQRGMLSSILQASSAFQGTGILFQQVIQAALNALEPFMSGVVAFGGRMGSSLLEQMKAKKDIGAMSLVARTNRSYFRIEFDPKTELQERRYKPLPVFKPSLPEDFLMKAQVARILLDPRRPIASLTTVLDRVLQWEDPEGEIQRIFADIANLDPVIVLERVAQALDEEGEKEIAARIRQQEFQAAFVKETQFRQFQAQAEATPGPGPETGATTATGGLGGRQGQGQPEQAGGGIGVLGEREQP